MTHHLIEHRNQEYGAKYLKFELRKGQKVFVNLQMKFRLLIYSNENMYSKDLQRLNNLTEGKIAI